MRHLHCRPRTPKKGELARRTLQSLRDKGYSASSTHVLTYGRWARFIAWLKRTFGAKQFETERNVPGREACRKHFFSKNPSETPCPDCGWTVKPA